MFRPQVKRPSVRTRLETKAKRELVAITKSGRAAQSDFIVYHGLAAAP